jgi:hypothetical protein
MPRFSRAARAQPQAACARRATRGLPDNLFKLLTWMIAGSAGAARLHQNFTMTD